VATSRKYTNRSIAQRKAGSVRSTKLGKRYHSSRRDDTSADVVSVGVRDFKNRLAEYLRLAVSGKRITITQHNRPIATLSAAEERPIELLTTKEKLERMASKGLIWLGSGKPFEKFEPIKLRGGATMSDAVIEDRR